MQLTNEAARIAKDQSRVEPKTQLGNHRLSLTCVCLSSNGLYAFTGSKDGSIVKWCLQTRKIVAKVNAVSSREAEQNEEVSKSHHTKHINCITISSDDKFLVSGGWDKQIRVWSPDNLSWVHTFSKHRQEVTALAFRDGHHLLYSGSADNSVMLWTLEDDDNRCFVEALFGHESTVTSMDVLKKERVLTAGGRDQTIRIWKIVEQAQTVYESKHESVDVVRYVDDKTFVSGGEDGSISVWTTMKRTPVVTIDNAHRLSPNAIEGLNFDQVPKLAWISSLATFSTAIKSSKSTKRVKLDDAVEGFTNEFDGDQGSDSDGADSDRGVVGKSSMKKVPVAMIASGSCNSEIKLWKLIKAGSDYELKFQQLFECPGFINDLEFTPDGKRLIAACGQEHKYGRWWKLRGSKNCIRIFDVN